MNIETIWGQHSIWWIFHCMWHQKLINMFLMVCYLLIYGLEWFSFREYCFLTVYNELVYEYNTKIIDTTFHLNRVLHDRYMGVWCHSAGSCTSISVLKKVNIFVWTMWKMGFLINSYFHELIQCILYQTLLHKGRSFRPIAYITCQVPFQCISLWKKLIWGGLLTLKPKQVHKV